MGPPFRASHLPPFSPAMACQTMRAGLCPRAQERVPAGLQESSNAQENGEADALTTAQNAAAAMLDIKPPTLRLGAMEVKKKLRKPKTRKNPRIKIEKGL